MKEPINESTSKSTIVQSDETLFRIIDGLNELGPVGVTELADHLDLSKSTVYKHLNTMVRHGYVINDGVYRLGFKFLSIGGNVRGQNRLANTAEKTVKELAKDTDQLVAFTVKDFDHGVFVFRENYRYGLEKIIPIGRRFHLHQNAAGKAMLAELPAVDVRDIVERQGLPTVTENTIDTEEKLIAELDEIRRRGYALNREERHEGINAIGAAIRDASSNTLGALSIAGPTNRLTETTLKDEYSEALLTKINELELQLQYG